MTERGRASLRRDAHSLSIGPSILVWERDTLTVTVDEIGVPSLARIRGTIKVHPKAVVDRTYWLDASRRHAWRPIAPRALVEVSLSSPAFDWRGEGYFDTNWGEAPLQDDFHAWDWSRAHLNTDTLLFYDVQRRDGEWAQLALRVGEDGDVQATRSPPRTRLPSTFWQIARNTRAEPGAAPTVRRTLEDTPFYARSILNGRYEGQSADIIHESLSLNRLRSPIVRAMLPFRMPRNFR
jgi:carotenoid 1,2-hydratase